MNFNTILYRLGIDPACFINQENEPIKTDTGFIYEVRQRTDERECPYCHSSEAYINDYDTIEINCSETDQRDDVLRIRKVRFKCRKCGKTFTPPIKGIEPYSKTSSQTLQMIYNDFTKMMTFQQIAERYGLTTARIMQIFDEKVRYVPRRPFPEILCIDEIRFSEDKDQKFCCVLYDFNRREIIDIIRNRQLPYLKEYFDSVPQLERDKVRYFISDMYDGYATVCRKYFKKATHIIDLFHVITQLTNAVNKIRVNVMNSSEKGSARYNFMKSHWNQFICRKERITDRTYTHKASKAEYHYDDMVFMCLKSDREFLEAYNILQDLFHYHQKSNYKEALEFIEFISKRLISTDNSLLISVGRTYNKWRFGIASGLARSQNKSRYTNAIAESINNQLKTIIKVSYGYHNFERFRKRAMLIITYNPKKKP